MAEKKKSGGILFYMVPVVLVIAMGVFGFLFMKDFLTYKSAGDEYAAIVEDYIQPAASSDNVGGSDTAEEAYYPALSVDYDALTALNSDFSAVLYIPALDMQYPIVHSRDNEDYLHKTFEGKSNFAGCIFLDCDADEDYSDKNSVIYGHNMKNGSMFGTLKRFRKEAGLCSSDPYIYLYRPDGVRKYRIFSYYLTNEGSDAYKLIGNDADYDVYVEHALRNSVYGDFDSSTVDFSSRPKLLTLSTCAGRSGGTQRFVVHALLVMG